MPKSSCFDSAAMFLFFVWSGVCHRNWNQLLTITQKKRKSASVEKTTI